MRSKIIGATVGTTIDPSIFGTSTEAITPLSATTNDNGVATYTLTTNTRYSATINSDCAFVLPSDVDTTIDNSIILYANFDEAGSVEWGDVLFYGDIVPEISDGSYDIVFVYNPTVQKWYAGVVGACGGGGGTGSGKDGADGKDGISATHSWEGTVLTVTSASGTSSADLKGDTGEKGNDGVGIKNAFIDSTGELSLVYSTGGMNIVGKVVPTKGVDYFTEADKAEINADNIAFISTELAKRGQLKPEFAQTVGNCTDTTKLYVVDGYIYAYMTKTETIEPTNQIRSAINADSTSYNGGSGWEKEYLLVAGSGEKQSNSSYFVTGFIPVKATDTFRIKNYGMAANATSFDNICFYDSSFAFIGTFTNSSTKNPLSQFVQDDGTMEACISTAGTTNFTTEQKSNIAYMRLSLDTMSNDTILVINEPLEVTTTTTTGFHNTGHAFVPADYEDRIVALEKRMNKYSVADSSAPMYVVEEAERVAKNVYAKQNANTFSFLAISDAHYLTGNTDIEQSVLHAGQAMDLVRKGVNIDFAVDLGDNGWGSAVEGSPYRATIEMGIDEIMSTNKCIDESFRGIPNFRAVGNHDSLVLNYSFNGKEYLTASKLFPLYGVYNRGAVFHDGNKEYGYCYRDFEDWKLRVICLNTSDIRDEIPTDATKQNVVSGVQGKWFAQTLDMSAKSNASEWSILILSHAPLDFGSGCIYLCDILKAYIDGGTYNAVTHDGQTISYNYAGKNVATIIGNCHGHNHNFKVDNLRRYVGKNEVGEDKTEAIDIKRFCIPNACFERNNERGGNNAADAFDIEYGEDTTYVKVAGTANDTAFCVVTIDTVARKIYADAYGAGYDREIDY